MTTDNEKKSWFTSLQGIITSVAALITAIGGLLVVLNVNGYFTRFEGKEKEDNFENFDAKKNVRNPDYVYENSQKGNFKKQFFTGNVGKLEANFELTFDWKNKKVHGVYNYPKRPGKSYDLIGIITNKGIELNELTANQVTATCALEQTNRNCYSGQMNNSTGDQFDMNFCKTAP